MKHTDTHTREPFAYSGDTPVLFVVFSRPDTTHKVFEAIRQAKPSKLYVAADAPREGREDEYKRCMEVREIVSAVDWECESHFLFREKNLGVAHGVSGAIDWFFSQEEAGIILEDDCLPNPSFFTFCEQLLRYYADDERVMHISGTNFLTDWQREPEASYYFSKLGQIWGWATWRRAWNHYDLSVGDYHKKWEKGWLDDFWMVEYAPHAHEFLLNVSKEGMATYTWDYQWDFALYKQRGVCISPTINLVSNLGLENTDTSTHTFDKHEHFKVGNKKALSFPLIHPDHFMIDDVSDNKTLALTTGMSPAVKMRLAMQKVIPEALWAGMKNTYKKIKG